MFKHLATASALALATFGTAHAGSLVEPVVVSPPTAVYVDPGRDWSGFYAGVNGDLGSLNNGGPNISYYGYGVHGGYLADMGDFVVGGEVSYEYTTVDLAAPNDTWHRIGGDLILGYDAGDFMPHVTAGVAGLRQTAAGGTWEMGWSAGAGASVMMSDNIMLTGRYRYTRYDNLAGGVNAHAGKLMISFRF
jgi:opacity protein-like surface antigen